MSESTTLLGRPPVDDAERTGSASAGSAATAGRPSDATETERRVVPDGDAARDDLLELLGDEYTRTLLEELSAEPASASDLVDRVEMSRATVYRRLNRLQEHGLVAADLAVEPSGNHHKVFKPTLERVTVDLDDGVPTVHVEVRDDDSDFGWPTPASAD